MMSRLLKRIKWVKRMKTNTLKIFLGVLALGIVGCGKTSTSSQNSHSSSTRPTQTIELTYADWGNSRMNQYMLDKFMEKYPNIHVSLRTDIAGSGATFTGNIIASAQAGLLPDVFAIDNVPTAVSNGLNLDVKQFWDDDPETDLVYPYIANTAIYNGKRLAIPSFQFFKGIMINLDIFEKKGLTTVAGKYRVDDFGYPEKDWTYSEFLEITKAITNLDLVNAENLVVGLDTWYGSPDFQQVWPTQNNANTQFDSWDGTKFNYTSSDWIDAMKEKVKLHNALDGTTTHFTEDQIAQQPALSGYLIETGVAAMDIEGSWQLGVIDNAKQNKDMNLGFWPYPQGSAGRFPPTILDYNVVSVQTQFPQEAYLLAKWMTFGRDGWDARISFYEEEAERTIVNPDVDPAIEAIRGFPTADYPELWERIEVLVDHYEGFSAIMADRDKAKPDLDKWLAGYKSFWAWVSDPENPYNWDNLCLEGPQAVPTYAAQWESNANRIVQGEMATLGAE